jgi:hypothetical protein
VERSPRFHRFDSGWEVAAEMDERRLLIAATVLVAAMLLAWWLTFGMP